MDIIKVFNITKKFGNNTVFKGLNFNVQKGEIVTIVGPSGQGKSTFLRCLVGLEKVNSGTIEIDNKTLVKDGTYVPLKEKKKVLSEVGMIFQSYNLFPNLTAKQNLKIVCNDDNKTNNLLKRFGLYDKKNLYPSSLSGGQKQRLAIIRALLPNPKIIFFDEPTAALDSENRKEIAKLINELKTDGYTIIVVTHDNALVSRLFTRVYNMR